MARPDKVFLKLHYPYAYVCCPLQVPFIYLSYPLPALVWLSTKRDPQIIFVPNLLKAIARRR